MRARRLTPLLLILILIAIPVPALHAGADDLRALMVPDISFSQDPISPAPEAPPDVVAPAEQPAAPPAAITQADAKPVVYLLPLGAGITATEIEFVRRSLVAFYAIDARVLPASALPAGSYYAPRRRYRAERILDYLVTRRPQDGYRIIGITAQDISTTNRDRYDWGMIGLADYDRPICVVSAYRCRGASVSPAQSRIRLGKVAVHEIGHTFGLPHCAIPGCIMNDAQGSVAICDREQRLCDRCRAELLQGGEPLTANVDFAWDRAVLDVR